MGPVRAVLLTWTEDGGPKVFSAANYPNHNVIQVKITYYCPSAPVYLAYLVVTQITSNSKEDLLVCKIGSLKAQIGAQETQAVSDIC